MNPKIYDGDRIKERDNKSFNWIGNSAKKATLYMILGIAAIGTCRIGLEKLTEQKTASISPDQIYVDSIVDDYNESPENYLVYEIKQGDTLSMKELQEFNNIENANKIYAGRQLVVPEYLVRGEK